MQAQWELQKKILTMARPLGIIGVLPAFQGNMCVALNVPLSIGSFCLVKYGFAHTQIRTHTRAYTHA